MLCSCCVHLLHAGRRHDLDADRRARAARSRSRGRRARLRAASCGTSGACRASRGAPARVGRRSPIMLAARGSSASSTRSSAASAARSRDLAPSPRSRAIFTATSTRSLDDRVDVAADVADLGELRRLDLHERRVRELREPARDLGLADAGRADHQDVLRRDLVAQRLVDLHAAPAVAQRDRDRALGVVLADDVLVELVDDLARRQSTSSPSELLDREVAVGVDADVGGDVRAPSRRSSRASSSVFVEQRARRGQRVRAAGADGDQRRARARSRRRCRRSRTRLFVSATQQQRLEPAQEAVGAPVLGELDRGAREVAVLLELAPRSARTA